MDAGLTPMQAIVAGTKTAAACVEMAADIGTLEAGKYADIIVVDGDPLADVTLLDGGEHLSLVMKGGTAHVNRLASARRGTPIPVESDTGVSTP